MLKLVGASALRCNDLYDTFHIQPCQLKPLQPHEDFRFITLAARKDGEGLSCVLKNVNFDKFREAGGRYLAISYAWGGQELTETIICSGYCVRITKTFTLLFRGCVYRSRHSMFGVMLCASDKVTIQTRCLSGVTKFP